MKKDTEIAREKLELLNKNLKALIKEVVNSETSRIKKEISRLENSYGKNN